VAAAVVAAAEARRLWLAKLAGMEQLLYSPQSAQFLDIRKREAEAFKVCTVQALAAEAFSLSGTRIFAVVQALSYSRVTATC